MRRVKRLRRTTLLNWVVGNMFLWQLLFAGPGAKSCFFAYTFSRSFHSLHLHLSFSSSLCSSARFLSISCSALPLHSPLLFFFAISSSSYTFVPSLIPSFCLCLGKTEKEHACITILVLHCDPQLQIEILKLSRGAFFNSVLQAAAALLQEEHALTAGGVNP